MGVLYLKRSPKWVNYLSNEELTNFIEMYTGNELVIGDAAGWSKQTIQKLLKIVETYPNLSVFSSKDFYNPILYSRFPVIEKSLGDTYSEDTNPESYVNLLQATQVPAMQRLQLVGYSPIKGIIKL